MIERDYRGPSIMASRIKAQRAAHTRSIIMVLFITFCTSALADDLGNNLLQNPGAEIGDISGWTGIPSFSVRSSNPPPFSGSFYFFAGVGQNHTLIQNLDLSSIDVPLNRIDLEQVTVSAGGYQRSFDQPEGIDDEGQITVHYLNSSLTILDTFTGPVLAEVDSWTATSDSRRLPAGTRFIRFNFSSTRLAGSNNDGYLDNGFVRLWDDLNFADSVIRYDPDLGGLPPDPSFQVPNSATGPVDFVTLSPLAGFVSLGQGGLLELAFNNNALQNSGDLNPDVYVVEVGPEIEAIFVAIRPTPATVPSLDPSGDSNGDGFFEIGRIAGATSSIDIDAIFPGHPAGSLQFDAIQLIDDPADGTPDSPSRGADIDAVYALSSSATQSIPSVSEWGLAILALLTLTAGTLVLSRRRPFSINDNI